MPLVCLLYTHDSKAYPFLRALRSSAGGLIRSVDDLVLKTQHNLFSAPRMPWWTIMMHNSFIRIAGLSLFQLEIVLQSAREW
jgi:hypothetical protein